MRATVCRGGVRSWGGGGGGVVVSEFSVAWGKRGERERGEGGDMIQ